MTETPSVEDNELVDMLVRLLDTLSASDELDMIIRTVTVTLPALTEITTSAAFENWLRRAERTAEASKDAMSPATVSVIDTTGE